MIAEKPLVAVPRDRCTYRPGTQSVPFFAAPRVLNRPHSITAEVEIPAGGAEGVLLCQGTAAGGYSLFVKDGKLRYVHNYVGRAVYGVESDHGPPARQARAQVRVRADRTSRTWRTARARPAGSSSTSTAPSPGTPRRPSPPRSCSTPARSPAAPTPAPPVTDDYPSPFKFTGTIDSVTVDVSGELIHDPEAELRMHMARQ